MIYEHFCPSGINMYTKINLELFEVALNVVFKA